MTTHELKCWPEYYDPIDAGIKTLELRLDDRGYRTGDTLLLREWEPLTHAYTGRECCRVVTHIVRGYDGLRPGYVAMSIAQEVVQ